MIKLFSKKYIVIFLNKELESFNIISQKNIKATTTKIKYGKKELIPIDISRPTYSKGLKLFYFIDLSSNLQLHFYENKNSAINSKAMDMIFSDEIIKQLTSNLGDKSVFKANIMNMIIGGLIGGLIGFIVASYLVKGGFGI